MIWRNDSAPYARIARATCAGIFIPFVIACGAMGGCSRPEPPRTAMRSIVMTTELVDDSAVIRRYDSMHSAQGVWPELKKANIASGIQEIRIFRFGNRLMMVIDVPEDTDLRKMDSLYVNADPKVGEWGRLMSTFQRSLPGVDSATKWVGMELIHHYRNGEYLK